MSRSRHPPQGWPKGQMCQGAKMMYRSIHLPETPLATFPRMITAPYFGLKTAIWLERQRAAELSLETWLSSALHGEPSEAPARDNHQNSSLGRIPALLIIRPKGCTLQCRRLNQNWYLVCLCLLAAHLGADPCRGSIPRPLLRLLRRPSAGRAFAGGSILSLSEA
jgi:hypothetical protein